MILQGKRVQKQAVQRRPRGLQRLLAALALLSLLAIALVLNASRPGSRVEGCPQGCATAAARQAGPLRVMSLNVLHGFPDFRYLPERLDLVAGEIARQDADIVLLQEVPWTLRLGSSAAYLAERTGMNYVFLRANGNRWAIGFEEGEAILSHYPLQEVTFAELAPRAGFFEHRVVLYAVAVTPVGQVSSFVTHLTHGADQVNQQQAAALMRFVAETGRRPAIVAGDFNATEDSPQIAMLAQAWIDTFRAVHPAEPGLTCCVEVLSDDPAQQPRKRIDYIFLVPDSEQKVQVVSSQRVLDRPVAVTDGWLWASDHIGLLSVIALE